MAYNGFCGNCMNQPCSCKNEETKDSNISIGSHAMLKNWIELIDTDVYIELYEGDTSVTGLIYEGQLKDFINDDKLMTKYGSCLICAESVIIDPPGVLTILLDN